MNIFFYATYSNQHEFLNTLRKKFKNDKIFTINDNIDLSPKGIRQYLQLNKPIYQRTAAYGHFGRRVDSDGGFSWEKTDLANKLKELAS